MKVWLIDRSSQLTDDETHDSILQNCGSRKINVMPTTSLNGLVSLEQVFAFKTSVTRVLLSPLLSDKKTLIQKWSGYPKKGDWLHDSLFRWSIHHWKAESEENATKSMPQKALMHDGSKISIFPAGPLLLGVGFSACSSSVPGPQLLRS